MPKKPLKKNHQSGHCSTWNSGSITADITVKITAKNEYLIMFQIAQTIVFKGFNCEAYILALTNSGYILALNSGYTYEMPFDQAHRIAK